VTAPLPQPVHMAVAFAGRIGEVWLPCTRGLHPIDQESDRGSYTIRLDKVTCGACLLEIAERRSLRARLLAHETAAIEHLILARARLYADAAAAKSRNEVAGGCAARPEPRP
jgi:hypothetical protein